MEAEWEILRALSVESQPLGFGISLWKGIWVLAVSPRQLEEPQKEPEQIPLIDTGAGCFQRSLCT